MADLSFTIFPALLPPRKNRYTLPAVELEGASLLRNNPLKNPITASYSLIDALAEHDQSD